MKLLQSALTLKEHLNHLKEKPVIVYGLKTYVQINPKTGERLLADLSDTELRTRVIAVRHLGKIVELSLYSQGEFPEKKKKDKKSKTEIHASDKSEDTAEEIEAIKSDD